MAKGPLLEPTHLPPELHLAPHHITSSNTHLDMTQGLESSVAAFEKQLVGHALAQADGNVVKASLLLKIPRGTLRYKMEKYGLSWTS
jgi:DNA-binding NtrC family response regulator